MPIDLIYDISVERDNQEYGKCIRAPESVFRMVAGILLKLSTEKPDASGMDDLHGDLLVNHSVQASFFSFALQCLGDALCEGDEDMPQNLRTKPTDFCVLQQEQAGEYVDVFDFGACLEFWINKVQETTQEIDTIRDLKDIYKQAPKDAEELLEKFEDLYEGTSESYDDKLVNDDLGKRAAICSALREVLNGYIIEAQRLKQQELDGNGIGVLAIGAAAAIVGLMGAALVFPPSAAAAAALYGSMVGAGTLAMGGALLGASGAALAIFTEVVKQTSMPILQDNAAKEAILCVWYDALKDDLDISHADFKQALTVSGGNAPALYSVVDSLRQIDLAYPAFLEKWASHITIGQAGAIYDECGCDDPGYQMVNMPGYTSIIDRLGVDGNGYDVYEISNLSNEVGGDTMWVRIVTEFSNRDFYIKETHLISNIANIRFNAVSHYPSFPPNELTQAFIVDVKRNVIDNTPIYPSKIRVHVQVLPL